MAGSTGATAQLDLKEAGTARPGVRQLWRLTAHWGCNAILALLWGKFAFNAYNRWVHSGSLILLGLVLFNTLLVTVTIARRPSISTSTQIKDWVAAVLTVAISLVFRPAEWHQSFAQAAGSILQGGGLMIMMIALTKDRKSVV